MNGIHGYTHSCFNSECTLYSSVHFVEDSRVTSGWLCVWPPHSREGSWYPPIPCWELLGFLDMSFYFYFDLCLMGTQHLSIFHLCWKSFCTQYVICFCWREINLVLPSRQCYLRSLKTSKCQKNAATFYSTSVNRRRHFSCLFKLCISQR